MNNKEWLETGLEKETNFALVINEKGLQFCDEKQKMIMLCFKLFQINCSDANWESFFTDNLKLIKIIEKLILFAIWVTDIREQILWWCQSKELKKRSYG